MNSSAWPQKPSKLAQYAILNGMKKPSLADTNPYLRDPIKRREMFYMTVSTSTEIEGVKLGQLDLQEEPAGSPRSKAPRVSAKSVE